MGEEAMLSRPRTNARCVTHVRAVRDRPDLRQRRTVLLPTLATRARGDVNITEHDYQEALRTLRMGINCADDIEIVQRYRAQQTKEREHAVPEWKIRLRAWWAGK